VPKTERPPGISESHQLGEKSGTLAENGNVPPSAKNRATAEGFASPAEGVELIRAFLNVKQRDVRAAIIKLVTSLSSVNSRAE
jgi:hypothetical protein